MLPMRKCRMRQLLNSVAITDETDNVQLSSIKKIQDALLNLKAIDAESNEEERIKHVDETFMDANIYNLASHVAYKCVQNINYTHYTFQADEFVNKLISFLSDGQPDNCTVDYVKGLEEHVLLDTFMPSLTNFSSVYGGLINRPVPQPKVRSQKDKVLNNAPAVKKKLIKVAEFEEENDKKSDDILRFHIKVLNDEYKRNDCNPVDYYEFVIDTEDFGLTVENIFYVSFVLNDGKIKLVFDNTVPKLLPLDKKSRLNLSQTDRINKNQMVTSISMAVWQAESSKIKEGILQRYRRSGVYTTK